MATREIDQYTSRLFDILAKVPLIRLVERRGRKKDEDEPEATAGTWDLIVTLVAGKEHWRLLTKVLTVDGPGRLRGRVHALHQFTRRAPRSYAVACAPYLTERCRDVFTSEGMQVGYVDLAGNFRLAFGPVYLERRGFQNPRTERRPLRTLFAPKAGRVLRVLLEDPRAAWRLQTLARTAGVSLGLAFKVKERLLDMEYAEERTAGLRLSRGEPLLRDWAAAGGLKARAVPCVAPGEIAELAQQLDAYCRGQQILYALTGMAAAARVLSQVRPADVAAYVQTDPAALAAALGWTPGVAGANCVLLQPADDAVFYAARTVDDVPIVSDMQLYLDLAPQGGAKMEVAAEILRERLRPRW